MRERVEQTGSGSVDERLEVATPGFLDTDGIDEAGFAVDTEALDVVHRTEQVIPRIGLEELAGLVFAARYIVDLQSELHRQPPLAREDDGLHVRLEVVDAALGLIRHRPERPRLPEVVDVLGEPDLVDARLLRRLDERLDRERVVRDLTAAVAKVHVVVDDHNRAATRLTVSATGSAGTTPSQPSFSAVKTRSTTPSSTSGRAASCTSTTAASSGTSASASRTDSPRVAPPVTQELTLLQPSSSASRIDGSSHSGGAATTIASTQSEASSRSRLSASNGRSPSRTNALGRSAPSRSPPPAAARMAQTLTSSRRVPSSSPCS